MASMAGSRSKVWSGVTPNIMARKAATKLRTYGAPDIRVERGDVFEETRLEISKTGRTGIVVSHRVNDWLRRHWKKGHLNEHQYAAGKRFAEVCEALDVGVRSQLATILEGRGTDDTGRWNAVKKAGAMAYNARWAYGKAVHVMGPQLAPVAVWVIVAGRSAKAWAEGRNLPAEDGIALLRAALNALVDHYQLREGLDR
jgi:hypothetical protein